jgi:hypothetical protein
MKMQRVSSKAIAEIGYDPATLTLRILFVDGRRFYDFRGVPEHLYNSLMTAPSKGEFYNDHIRDKYQS